MTDLFTEATHDPVAERFRDVAEKSASLLAPKFAMLTEATTRDAYEDRKSVIMPSVEHAIQAIAGNDPALFATALNAVVSQWDADFDAVLDYRTERQARLNARRAHEHRLARRKTASADLTCKACGTEFSSLGTSTHTRSDGVLVPKCPSCGAYAETQGEFSRMFTRKPQREVRDPLLYSHAKTARRKTATITYSEAAPEHFIADFDKHAEALKPFVMDFPDDDFQGVSPDAPEALVSSYQGLLQRGYANGYFASKRKTAVRYQVLVAIDWDGTGDIEGLKAKMGDALMNHSVDETDDGKPKHLLTFDTRQLRNTHAHGYGFHSGFIVHIEDSHDMREGAKTALAPSPTAVVNIGGRDVTVYASPAKSGQPKPWIAVDVRGNVAHEWFGGADRDKVISRARGGNYTVIDTSKYEWTKTPASKVIFSSKTAYPTPGFMSTPDEYGGVRDRFVGKRVEVTSGPNAGRSGTVSHATWDDVANRDSSGSFWVFYVDLDGGGRAYASSDSLRVTGSSKTASPEWKIGNNGTGARVWFVYRDVRTLSGSPSEYAETPGGSIKRFETADQARQYADKLNRNVSFSSKISAQAVIDEMNSAGMHTAVHERHGRTAALTFVPHEGAIHWAVTDEDGEDEQDSGASATVRDALEEAWDALNRVLEKEPPPSDAVAETVTDAAEQVSEVAEDVATDDRVETEPDETVPPESDAPPAEVADEPSDPVAEDAGEPSDPEDPPSSDGGEEDSAPPAATPDDSGSEEGTASDPESLVDSAEDATNGDMVNLDPTTMGTGDRVNMTYTLSDGTTGDVDVTFVREDNDVFFFDGPMGEFGIGDRDGTWVDSEGNQFAFSDGDALEEVTGEDIPDNTDVTDIDLDAEVGGSTPEDAVEEVVPTESTGDDADDDDDDKPDFIKKKKSIKAAMLADDPGLSEDRAERLARRAAALSEGMSR